MATKAELADSIAHLPLHSRVRIEKSLDDVRDGAYSLAALCLAAQRAVHTNHTDAAEQLAEVISKCQEHQRLALTIASEMNANLGTPPEFRE